MKQYIMAFAALFLFLAAVVVSCSMDINAYGEDVSSQIEGTLYIDLPDTMPYDFSTNDLDGSVTVMIGNNEHTIPVSNITHDAVYNRLIVPLSTTVNFEGVAVIIAVSHLTYTPSDPTEEDPIDEEIPEEPDTEEPTLGTPEDELSVSEAPSDSISIPWAGYLITSLTKDSTNWINDTDHDKQVSSSERETMPLSPAIRFYSYAQETEPVQVETPPIIEYFNTTAQYSTADLSIGLSGAITSLDWGLVYVRVNNQYWWIEPVQDQSTPDRVVFPESDDDPFMVTLKPGINEIQLFVINSQGFLYSETATIDCTASLHEEMETILITLRWDTTADLDLHTWYYPPESEEAAWHNSYANPEAPDIDEIVNLDADNQTGFGPEHFTLLGAPDGHYIVAVNAYSLNGLSATNAFVSIETNTQLHSLGPFRITEENADEYPANNNDSWVRVADILITENVAELSSPDMSLEPPEMFDIANTSETTARSIKYALKFR